MAALSTEYFDESTVNAAVGGCCHDFAIALHRMTGWPIACLWRDSMKDVFSITDEPTPLHVFCVAPDGRAVDVEGAADFDAMTARYSPYKRDRERSRVEIHGSEADWERVTTDISTAASLAPRDHRIEAAAAVIPESAKFLDLIAALAGNPSSDDEPVSLSR